MISQMVRFGTIEREQRYRSTNVYRLLGVQSTSTTDVASDSTTDVEQKESVKEKHTTVKIKGFGYFCQIYPCHRLGSVRRLREYWISNTLEEKAKDITDSVKDFKLSSDWNKDKGKYVPGALKFLDEERWITFEEFDPMKQFEED